MSELQTNNMDLLTFSKFIKGVATLEYFGKGKKAPMPKEDFILLFRITYFCALRISETLNLTAGDFHLDKKILILKNTKTGKNKKTGKYTIQKTTIPPPLIAFLEAYRHFKPDEKLFSCTRQTVWKYAKVAGRAAGLNFGEEQKVRSIEGLWTHAFRKGYSKFMQTNGASRELRMLKLRHSFTDAQDAYDVTDLNSLIAWEKKVFG